MTLPAGLGQILAEQEAVFARMAPGTLDSAVEAIASAPRVLVWGAGRTGFALMGFAMRLGHVGLDAHWLPGVTTPPLRPGDLLVTNASRGDLPSATAFLHRARALGATGAVFTAAESGPALEVADLVWRIPAQVWEGESVLPMGGQYEIALWLFCDLVVARLMAQAGLSAADLAARHATVA